MTFGLVFGFCFPLFGLISDLFWFNDIPLSVGNILNRILENPIHFIIFSAPLVLGVTFYFIGKSVEERAKVNAELARKNLATEANNELLDAFNYHVSHDLKTVLSNQLILSRMIGKYVEKGEYEKVGEIVQKLVESCNNGLETVLGFLKISQDGFVSDRGNNSEIDVVAEVNRLVHEFELAKKINLKISKKQFTKITIDRKVFESILLNLITNAVKYNNNFPEIEIELKVKNGGKYLVFSDNGVGIDLKKDGDKLFKPFNRFANSKNVEGSGIGLFLVKKMVHACGGEIAVESELNKGTTFTIVFYD